jgi:hypothetical protein
MLISKVAEPPGAAALLPALVAAGFAAGAAVAICTV